MINLTVQYTFADISIFFIISMITDDSVKTFHVFYSTLWKQRQRSLEPET